MPTSALSMPSTLPEHGDVRLRAFRYDDADMLIDLATDRYVCATGSLPYRADRDEARAYVRRQWDRLVTGAGYSFCIADRQSDAALGMAGLWLAALGNGRAGAGYSVAPRSRGRRVASQALVALTEFAWSVDGLWRIELCIEPWNVASIRTAESAGYEREGALRSYQEIDGVRVDMLMYSVLRPANRTNQATVQIHATTT